MEMKRNILPGESISLKCITFFAARKKNYMRLKCVKKLEFVEKKKL